MTSRERERILIQQANGVTGFAQATQFLNGPSWGWGWEDKPGDGEQKLKGKRRQGKKLALRSGIGP